MRSNGATIADESLVFETGDSYTHIEREPINTLVEATFSLEAQMSVSDLQEHLRVIINNPHMVASLPSFMKSYDQYLPDCTIYPIFTVTSTPTSMRVTNSEVNLTLYLPGRYNFTDLKPAITDWLQQAFKAELVNIIVNCKSLD